MNDPHKPTKPAMTSKTIVANRVAAVVPYIVKWLGIELPPAEVAVLLIAIVNIGLRFVTKKGISLT